jgi:hypothetical protein
MASYLFEKRKVTYSKHEYECRMDRLCGLVDRVPNYRSIGPGYDSRHYQIFREVVGLERGPLSLVRTIEELFQGNSGFGLGNRN